MAGTINGEFIRRGGPVSAVLDEHHPRPRPRIGGFRSDRPITQEYLDELMADGFGE